MTPQSIQRFKELQKVAMFDMPAKEFEALSKAKKTAIEKARKEFTRRENERTQSLQNDENAQILQAKIVKMCSEARVQEKASNGRANFFDKWDLENKRASIDDMVAQLEGDESEDIELEF